MKVIKEVTTLQP